MQAEPAAQAALRHALTALRRGGMLVATAPFHGYVRNLRLALSARLDDRWQALREQGRVRFFSRHTLLALLSEAGILDLHFETLGRIPIVARSMLVAAKKPALAAGSK
jgi:2-polyprenyl-6-hydroxyphenyl methylase/3-demethylubiquinone-9 3-methyltransferase